MYTPTLTNRAAVLRDNYGNYLLAQLRVNPEVASEAVTFQAAQQALTDRLLDHERATSVSLEALAGRDRAHAFLDDEIRSFSQAVRRSTINDFRSPLYRNYFPNGTPAITSAPIAVTMVKVEDILAKLATEERPQLTAHIEPLTNALQALRDAIQVRTTGEVVESRALAALMQEKRHWRDAYQQVYARLRLYFHDEPRRADLFFRRAKASKRDEAEPAASRSQQFGTTQTSDADSDPNSDGATSEKAVSTN